MTVLGSGVDNNIGQLPGELGEAGCVQPAVWSKILGEKTKSCIREDEDLTNRNWQAGLEPYSTSISGASSFLNTLHKNTPSITFKYAATHHKHSKKKYVQGSREQIPRCLPERSQDTPRCSRGLATVIL